MSSDFEINTSENNKTNEDIEKVQLIRTKLSNLPAKTFIKVFPNVKVLWLTHNYGLKNLSSDDFQGSIKLTFINLDHNEIEILKANNFKEIPQLKHLNLNNNSINTIEDFAFKELNQLNILSLIENKVWHVTSNTFSGLRSLKKLSLQRNMIHFVSFGAFSDLFSLVNLELNNNKCISQNFDPYKDERDTKMIYSECKTDAMEIFLKALKKLEDRVKELENEQAILKQFMIQDEVNN